MYAYRWIHIHLNIERTCIHIVLIVILVQNTCAYISIHINIYVCI